MLDPGPGDVTIGAGGDDGAGDPAVEKAVDAAIDQVAGWAGIPDLHRASWSGTRSAPPTSPADYNAWQGGALGLEHTLRQSAMFRPRERLEQGATASTTPGRAPFPASGCRCA